MCPAVRLYKREYVMCVGGPSDTYHPAPAPPCSESAGLGGGAWCEHAQLVCPPASAAY